ncbi:MAG: TetR family transcriptional regulator [Solirubrobacteraceae bacterium]|nr:TetR family transcriptional regulator [Solirubrobacteraceae bacterium]
MAPPRRLPYAEAARELLRDSLLDAAGDLLNDRTWSQVTMAGVAKGAGVSRQTLYNEFGSREEFAQAFVLREVDRFLAAVEEAVQANLDDPMRAVSTAFGVFLMAAAQNPLVRSILADDGTDELLPLVTTHGGPVIDRATQRLAGVFSRGWPNVAERKALLLAESVVRLAISFAALPQGPSGLSPDTVAELLGPFIRDALAEGDANAAAA